MRPAAVRRGAAEGVRRCATAAFLGFGLEDRQTKDLRPPAYSLQPFSGASRLRLQASRTHTRDGAPRGVVPAPAKLEELWFNTGTRCNLACEGCYTESNPTNDTLKFLTRGDVVPFIEEALELGVRQLNYTGGEPFYNPHFAEILNYSLSRLPTMVLTNGTAPVRFYLRRANPAPAHPLKMRVSLDRPHAAGHDRIRGKGTFAQSIKTINALRERDIACSVAGRIPLGEEGASSAAAYQRLFVEMGWGEMPLVLFPEFDPPDEVPEITTDCIGRYKTEAEVRSWMCSYLRMVVRNDRGLRVYACTVTQDSPHFDLGSTLRESLQPVHLAHHRCFTMCFAGGASCSEAIQV